MSSNEAFPSVADVVVIGAGPAGMFAALEAREQGLSVVVVDEQSSPGGQIYRHVLVSDATRARVLGPDYLAGASLARHFMRSGVRYLRNASVWDVSADDGGQQVHVLDSGVARRIDTQAVIYCGGAQERPFPIPGWTLPGVLTAGAAQILLKRDGCVPGTPAVLIGCGPLLYLLADQYLRAGAPIRAVLDTTTFGDYLAALPLMVPALRSRRAWADLTKGLGMMRRLKQAKVPHLKGVDALALEANADGNVAKVCFTHRGRRQFIDTDVVLLHQGVVPNTQFSRAMRAPHVWSGSADCWAPITDAWGEIAQTGIFLAGDGRGIVGAHAAALQGRLAALAVAARAEKITARTRDALAKSLWRTLRAETALRPMLNRLYRAKAINRVPQDDVIVCRCEEVSAGEIRHTVELGCTGANQVKAFTRCGMGPCQGASCGLTVTEVVADTLGKSPDKVGAFRVRPPLKPVTLGQLADADRRGRK